MADRQRLVIPWLVVRHGRACGKNEAVTYDLEMNGGPPE